MTNTQIKTILDNRGYIIESDCVGAPDLSSGDIEKYKGSASKYCDQGTYRYALYNPKKITEDKLKVRVSYKKSIAEYMCEKAKSKTTIHYNKFNKFLETLGLDYHNDADIKKLVEEISEDFKSITKGAILSAILITKDGKPSDGFWMLSDVKSRIGTQSKEDFHQKELMLLQNNLSNISCDMN